MRGWDYEDIAAELLRSLRGKRSQTAFSRRLGYRSNVVYSWETGRAFPTAAKALWAAQRVGCDVPAALLTLYRKPPGWLQTVDATSPEGVVRFLNELRGRTPMKQVTTATGLSRFAVARWLKGETEPRLPDLLRLIEALSLRMIDFVAALVDPAGLPSLKAAWKELELARQATYDLPWTQAVLRVLETQAYANEGAHKPRWIAARLGLSEQQESEALQLLLATGQVELCSGKYRPTMTSQVIDTRRDPAAARRLRAFWSEVALERLKAGEEGLFSHNLFGVSELDLQRIRELQKAHYQEVRAIVAQSQPVERVALLNLQLVPLFKDPAPPGDC